MELNEIIKLFLYLTSLLEKVLEKPNLFCRIMVSIKIVFEKSFVKNNMFFWSQNIQRILNVFSDYWECWGYWRWLLFSVRIHWFWYICGVICVLETCRRDVWSRMSRWVWMIWNVNDRRYFGNSSKIYSTGRKRFFWESGACRITMERQFDFAICILCYILNLDIWLWWLLYFWWGCSFKNLVI